MAGRTAVFGPTELRRLLASQVSRQAYFYGSRRRENRRRASDGQGWGGALTATTETAAPADVFRHEAMLYAGPADYVARTVPFIIDGLSAGEPVLVAAEPTKLDLVRAALDRDADRVRFANLADVGRNPSRIIPVWHDFVDECGSGGQRVRGIGEPIWAGRTAAEVVECQVHESLLNLAFADSTPWTLICPYDTDALDPGVIDRAYRSHPMTRRGDARRPSTSYRAPSEELASIGHALPEPTEVLEQRTVVFERLHDMRSAVARCATSLGLGSERTADLVIAVDELASNSAQYGGGDATMRLWQDEDCIVCEVTDRGAIDEPLVGRHRPALNAPSGRGLWLVNQLCDLVQLRTSAGGTVVRLHMALR